MTKIDSVKFSGFGDIVSSFMSWRLWLLMSTQDIKQRYRGSVLGPIWIAGGLVAISFGIGTLYASLFNQPIQTFIPFVAVSMALWTFISACINEGCHTYLSAASLMRNTPLPIFLYVIRVVGRNLIVLAHNIVIVAVIFIFFQKPVNLLAFYALAGLLLDVVACLWIVYLVGIASARFRDVAQIVTYLTTFIMFLTPLFWDPSAVSETRRLLLDLNPFYHMIEVVRAPILGVMPSDHNWLAMILFCVIGGIVSYVVHVSNYRKIVLWL